MMRKYMQAISVHLKVFCDFHCAIIFCIFHMFIGAINSTHLSYTEFLSLFVSLPYLTMRVILSLIFMIRNQNTTKLIDAYAQNNFSNHHHHFWSNIYEMSQTIKHEDCLTHHLSCLNLFGNTRRRFLFCSVNKIFYS